METYQEMPLPAELLRALADLKFEKPTQIQSAVIPKALEQKDLMACAETGSGKTAAYAIPMVAQLLKSKNQNSLILAPTRELAMQIADFIRQLTTHSKGLRLALLVGGADMRRQLQVLKKKPRIVVATPGRLNDHLERKTIHLNMTKIMILDEGDRMLDMGFAPQLDQILKFLPKKRQTSLFTATLPGKVQILAKKYLSEPEKISVGRTSLPVESIKQSIVQMKIGEKNEKIIDELNERKGSIIVFTRTKRRTDSLAQNLNDLGFSVGLIHGGRSQGQRNRAIKNFKTGKSRILCATDVAARGIDIPTVEHVINFDLPDMTEDYVHRIGRTARNGAKGEAVSFITPEDYRDWLDLVRKYKIKGAELEGVSDSDVRKFSRSKSSGRRGESARRGRRFGGGRTRTLKGRDRGPSHGRRSSEASRESGDEKRRAGGRSSRGRGGGKGRRFRGLGSKPKFAAK